MKKEVKRTTYRVYRGLNHGIDGYYIDDDDGNYVTFFPAKIREPEDVFHDYTAEISVFFFAFIADAQKRGINVVFCQ